MSPKKTASKEFLDPSDPFVRILNNIESIYKKLDDNASTIVEVKSYVESTIGAEHDLNTKKFWASVIFKSIFGVALIVMMILLFTEGNLLDFIQILPEILQAVGG